MKFGTALLNAALFSGVAAAFVAAPSAEAAVVVRNLTATPISITNSIDGIYMNVVTNTTGSSGTVVTGWDLNPYNNGAGLTFYGAASPSGVLATGTAGTTAIAQSLTVGTSVSSTSTGFYNQFQTVGTSFQSTSGTQYLGFRFLNESTGATNYGYLQLTTVSGTGFPAAITGYAYENTGLGITVANISAVPEPATYAMFGLGLAAVAGLGLRRRRSV